MTRVVGLASAAVAIFAAALAWLLAPAPLASLALAAPGAHLSSGNNDYALPASCAHALVKGRRWRQEDRASCTVLRGACASPPSELRWAAVFDGHDGDDAAELAATRLHAMVDEALTRTRRDACAIDDRVAERAMREAIARLDAEFLASGRPGGTTLAAALVRGESAWIAHVGDARVISCARRDPIRQHARPSSASTILPPRPPTHVGTLLTRDHTPDDPAERARIESAGGWVRSPRAARGGRARVNDELAVSRAVGDASLRSFGVIPVPTVSRRILLSEDSSGDDDAEGGLALVSDGVSEILSEDEICSLTFGGGPGGWTEADFRAWRRTRLDTDTARGAVIALGGESSAEAVTGPKDAGETAAGASNDPEKWNIPIETGVTGWLRKGPAAATRAAVSAGAGDNVAVVALTTRQIAPPLQVSSPRRGASPNRLRPGTRLVPAFAGTCRAHSEGSSLVDLVDVCAASFALEAVVPPTFYGWLGDNPAEVDPGDRDDLGLGDGSGFDEGGGGAGWAELDGWIDGFRRSGEGVPSTRAIASGDASQYVPSRTIPPSVTSDGHEGSDVSSPSAAVARFLGAIGGVPLHHAPSLMPTMSSRSSFGAGEIFPAAGRPFARGHFGEVWRARRVGSSPESPGYVLKRILVDRGEEVRLSGRREAYFGELTRGAPGIVRYESAFELRRDDGARGGDDDDGDGGREGEDETELWLVFRDEGKSLAALMYGDGGEDEKSRIVGDSSSSSSTPPPRVVGPSRWWTDARRSADGRRRLRAFLRQTLEGTARAHALGVAHRDVKPSNLLVSGDVVRLADFGSAVDERSLIRLYGAVGPSASEQTPDYAPPEFLFDGGLGEGIGAAAAAAAGAEAEKTEGNAWKPNPERGVVERYMAYDVWSLGVVTLETLCLGTPRVFAPVGGRVRAGIERRLRGAGEETRELAVRIRAMLELCVIPPRSDVAALLSWECTEDALMAQLAARDPTGVGVSRWALRLVRRMLSWDPADRPTAERALTHAFFRGEDADGAGYTCERTAREFEFPEECATHCGGECE